MVLESGWSTVRRKLEHIEIVLSKPVEGPGTAWFEYVFLPQRALPAVEPDRVSTRVGFLGKEIAAPVMITGMTGGAPGTEAINRSLAEAACRFRIALGLGSQRAALESEQLAHTYRVARDVCPEMPIVGNIGISELVRYGPGVVNSLASMIEADAIAVHLNYFQEVVQPEGAAGMSKGLDALFRAAEVSSVPLIVKEVGFGISKEFAAELYSGGVRCIDVAGAGGTNWALVELHRALASGDLVKQYAAEGIKEVGIPTAASIIEVRNVSGEILIIGSGGVRSPYDAVKALRLGADVVGLARPVLVAYSKRNLNEFLEGFLLGMRAILASLGVSTLSEVRKAPVVVTGLLKDWIHSRGLFLW